MIWILFIGTMALSLWAMWRVKSVYKRYNQGVVRGVHHLAGVFPLAFVATAHWREAT